MMDDHMPSALDDTDLMIDSLDEKICEKLCRSCDVAFDNPRLFFFEIMKFGGFSGYAGISVRLGEGTYNLGATLLDDSVCYKKLLKTVIKEAKMFGTRVLDLNATPLEKAIINIDLAGELEKPKPITNKQARAIINMLARRHGYERAGFSTDMWMYTIPGSKDLVFVDGDGRCTELRRDGGTALVKVTFAEDSSYVDALETILQNSEHCLVPKMPSGCKWHRLVEDGECLESLLIESDLAEGT